MIIRELHSLQKFTKSLQIKKHVVKHKKLHFQICISLLFAAFNSAKIPTTSPSIKKMQKNQ